MIEVAPPTSFAAHSILAQDGYFIPNFNMFADVLSDQDDLPEIKLVWHMPRSVGTDQVLVLPADLSRHLDTFMQLDEKDRRKVLRASYWLHHAQEVWDLSKSANRQALVQTVEVLTEVPKGQPKCAECGRTIGTVPNKSFC